MNKADPWPLNPKGELLLGVKEEDKYALANVEENLKVPGIGVAEWGPGDMAISLGILATGEEAVHNPAMIAAPGEGFRSLQGEPHCLSELHEQAQRDRHDQGRRDGGARKRRNRRDRAQIHQSPPAILEVCSQTRATEMRAF